MNDIALYPLAFIVVLGVLVTVHELGHYLAARACGVKVLRFSIGFGRALWRRRYGPDQTEWCLGLLPLGGYVKMLDEREGEVAAAERHRSFNAQSVGRRSIIVAAGPFANFALAVVLYWAVFVAGTNELLPVTGAPPAETAAAAAGVQAGDEVLAVEGEPVRTWDELRWRVLAQANTGVPLHLSVINPQRERRDLTLDLPPLGADDWQGDPVARIGLQPWRPALPPVVGRIVPGSPAATGGLQAGDRIVAVAAMPVDAWQAFVTVVREHPGQPLDIDVDRAGERRRISLIPETVSEGGQTLGRIGAAVAEPPAHLKPRRGVVSYGPLEAAAKAVNETWEKSLFTLRMFGRMLVGEVSWRNISGPVTIADYAGQSARAGLDYYLKFMALVSISLGVLNLLPVPLLDGGHLMYHTFEIVMGRPLSARAAEAGQKLGLVLLGLLMVLAFFNDIARLLAG